MIVGPVRHRIVRHIPRDCRQHRVFHVGLATAEPHITHRDVNEHRCRFIRARIAASFNGVPNPSRPWWQQCLPRAVNSRIFRNRHSSLNRVRVLQGSVGEGHCDCSPWCGRAKDSGVLRRPLKDCVVAEHATEKHSVAFERRVRRVHGMRHCRHSYERGRKEEELHFARCSSGNRTWTPQGTPPHAATVMHILADHQRLLDHNYFLGSAGKSFKNHPRPPYLQVHRRLVFRANSEWLQAYSKVSRANFVTAVPRTPVHLVFLHDYYLPAQDHQTISIVLT